ncbi:MAG: hypothetical protein GTN81_09800 [Proteobacteria bacterium]|nr:hypothetical protein [Pseudomonadota bacterium]
MPRQINFTLRPKDIAKSATARLNEITSGNITAALVNTYYTAGIIPARLRREVGGTPLYVEEAAIWAAVAKALFISRFQVKLEWIARVLRLVVPSGYARSSFKKAPFSDIGALWEWLRENRTWGKLLRHAIDSGIEIGDEDPENHLAPHIADQADKAGT